MKIIMQNDIFNTSVHFQSKKIDGHRLIKILKLYIHAKKGINSTFFQIEEK